MDISHNIELLRQTQVQLFVWSNRHDDGLARPFSREMERRYGQKVWYRLKDELVRQGVMELVEPAQFRTDTDKQGRRRKGRTAGYRVQPPAHITVTTNGPMRPYTEAERRYFETHERTNLVSAPFMTTKNADTDGRAYTDFTSSPKVIRTQLTIDGTDTVSLDISNAFFCGIAEQLPQNITHRDVFHTLVFTGRLYDEIAERAGVSRDAVKLTLNKAANSSHRLSFYDDRKSGIAGHSQSTAWSTFRMMFPQIARHIRLGARNKTNWHIGNQWESRHRKAVQNMFWGMTGYQAMDCHDEFYVKVRDLHTLLLCVYRVSKNIPFKVGGHRYTTTSSLPLVCNTSSMDPVLATAFNRFFTMVDDEPPSLFSC